MLQKSARLDCRTENIRVCPIVISELELVDIQREILRTDFVERADDAALHDGPEAFDGVCVNVAMHVLAVPMIDSAVWIFPIDAVVAAPLIRRDKTDSMGNSLPNEAAQCLPAKVVDHAGNHVALALHGPDDNFFSMSASAAGVASPSGAAALVAMPILGLPADKGFINFNEADKLAEILIAECHADFVRHLEGCMIRTKAHHSHDLKAADTLLAGQHEIDDLEPKGKLDVRVLEDRADKDGETITGLRTAYVALPVIGLGAVFLNLWIAAARASNSLRPAASLKVGLAGILGRELAIQFREGHGLGFMDYFHGAS